MNIYPLYDLRTVGTADLEDLINCKVASATLLRSGDKRTIFQLGNGSECGSTDCGTLRNVSSLGPSFHDVEGERLLKQDTVRRPSNHNDRLTL